MKCPIPPYPHRHFFAAPFGHWGGHAFLILWLVIVSAVCSAEPSVPARDVTDPLSQRIDRLLLEHWRTHGIRPAPRCDDATFVRRVYLDLTGRIPPAAVARQFVASADPAKRRKLVDRLLRGPGFVTQLAFLLQQIMIPEADKDPQRRSSVPPFTLWLEGEIRSGQPYDRIVYRVLTADRAARDESVADGPAALRASPAPFFETKRFDPAKLTRATFRAFLGIRLDCAQCHDHPFDRWSQTDFWAVAAFFADNAAGRAGTTGSTGARVPTIHIPNSDRVVEARFPWPVPDATEPHLPANERLARWVTSEHNFQFARAIANRIWAMLFGRGLVEPVDDFSEHNPPVVPDVLAALAEGVREHRYDLRTIVRALVLSEAYQRSSEVSGAAVDADEQAVRNFARMAVRPLSGGQLYDSLAIATGAYDAVATLDEFVRLNTPRQRFLQVFGGQSLNLEDRQRTILQALLLMNGRAMDEATDPQRSRTLRAVLELPGLTDRQRVDALFWSAFSRPATAAEWQAIKQALADVPPGERPRVFGDVFWALLNSVEFCTNH
ncbi:MAG: DUF1553 domain-containing protein [Planctomycetota bacterium]|nr:MAG: DUF1553 domain-containing protein [Planctomycetota bacterium]